MRLFVGIALPADIRLTLGTLCAGLVGARWISTENMHMTLRFIGDVEPDGATELDAALSDIHAPSFEMQLSEIGHFANKSRLRALWVGVASNPALNHLQGKVAAAAMRAGFQPEGRKFTPHVTLARFRAQRVDLTDYLEANGAFNIAPFPVERITLFESHLGHGGANYIALKEYALGGLSHD
jgi:RNA 2',3'-cyclic 3'-phosphodiesterase